MPKRRFLRYGLRTFLAVITVMSVLLGRYMYRVNQQKAAVAWEEENRGRVTYDFYPDVVSPRDPVAEFAVNNPPGPEWSIVSGD